jgi:mRNA interferase MazF
MALIRRGDVRWFSFAKPDKRRPVLVLGRDDVLPALSLVPVIPLSTQIRGLDWEVPLGPDDGLPSPCVLKPEWIRAVDRALLGARMATLPEARWAEVERALLDVLGFAPPGRGARGG